ncbi:aa3-type cytochrome c oxidase subunit IV [Tianweitania sp. BSSL-BM11]|uniref:Aa3-type cytochrome c oxidase subunit IV n=1 Tax=Tianweitania aestuarii TaxID=2814886 RepID=A0ABS5RZJ0_9HYPH|nr:aa3-type cytochrome c oxidase subunit IV [Tianweitania aestuarii]MBS9722466.1 aa3-type cytochrome c oxidase subunit IV [Tianweitania aestuarii]
MADQTPSGPLEMGAEMDYSEHEKTYEGFLALTKYGTLVVVALMIAMGFGFFMGGGFISSIILFAILCAGGTFFLRSA